MVFDYELKKGYADFKRESSVPPGSAPPPASRTKVWFTLEYRL